MSETIIVGVDGSETAQRAARRAAELAVKLDADLVVMPMVMLVHHLDGVHQVLLERLHHNCVKFHVIARGTRCGTAMQIGPDAHIELTTESLFGRLADRGRRRTAEVAFP